MVPDVEVIDIARRNGKSGQERRSASKKLLVLTLYITKR
jgi:hypothetical protein